MNQIINDYEEICEECNGEGFVHLNVLKIYSMPDIYQCIICNGSGKFFWTDKIMNRNRNKKLPDGKYGWIKKEGGKWYWNV